MTPVASQWAAVGGVAGRKSVIDASIGFGRRAFFRARQGRWFRYPSLWKKRLWLALLGALLSGCSGWMGPPAEIQYDNPATQQLMHQLMETNAGLEAIKGLGRVTVTTGSTTHTYERAVWVGAAPGRLRFVFQAPTGMPVFSMSCDAEWLTALNYGDGRYYRQQIGDNSLSRYLPVSIKCADLYALLVDRPPKVAYDAVRLDTAQSAGGDSLVLLLQRRFYGTVGRIRVDRNTGDLQAVELLNIHGNRLYEARLQAIKTIEGYRLPTRITLSGPDGSLVLDVRRCWPESSVTEDLFRIAPPQTE